MPRPALVKEPDSNENRDGLPRHQLKRPRRFSEAANEFLPYCSERARPDGIASPGAGWVHHFRNHGSTGIVNVGDDDMKVVVRLAFVFFQPGSEAIDPELKWNEPRSACFQFARRRELVKFRNYLGYWSVVDPGSVRIA